MPAATHSFYLRNMYHMNLLAKPGGLCLSGVPLDLTQITTPTFILSAREDHIARGVHLCGNHLYKGQAIRSSGLRHMAGAINAPEQIRSLDQ